MATGHFLTNRGKYLLTKGEWDTAAAGAIKCGYIQASQNAAYDTAVEVAQLNFVANLLNTTPPSSGAAGLAQEANFSGYSRFTLTRTSAVEDDTNNRVNFSCSTSWTITSAGGTTNNTLYGVFFYTTSTGTTDADYPLLSIDWFTAPITTNGGSLTYALNDIYRAS